MKTLSTGPWFRGIALAFAAGMGFSPAPAAETPEVAGHSAAFAVSLYEKLATADGNVFFSPLSVSEAMAMTYCGARGATEEELKTALHFQVPQEKLPGAFKALNGELMADSNRDDQHLRIANGLCLTKGDVSEDFKALLKTNFDAELFSGDLQEINGWVREKTEGKIDKILEQLDPNSVCVLLNAVYFKGTWDMPFKKEATREEPFKLNAKRQVLVPFMRQKSNFRAFEWPSHTEVSLPYKNGQLSMVIFLPKETEGLAKLEKDLTPSALRSCLSALDESNPVPTELTMPQYKLETSYNLVPAFEGMGAKKAFMQGEADCSGMGWKKGDLWISQIRHKAYLELNEEGSEAAAATAVEMATRSAMPSRIPRRIQIDHPFLFLIRHNATGVILFMGRVMNPANPK